MKVDEITIGFILFKSKAIITKIIFKRVKIKRDSFGNRIFISSDVFPSMKIIPSGRPVIVFILGNTSDDIKIRFPKESRFIFTLLNIIFVIIAFDLNRINPIVISSTFIISQCVKRLSIFFSKKRNKVYTVKDQENVFN
jgi:hypothetical protein